MIKKLMAAVNQSVKIVIGDEMLLLEGLLGLILNCLCLAVCF